MFGYVRPLKGELKVREFSLYKAAYCGLCHTLKGAYGLAARFCVNYDLTFLAMLLSEQEKAVLEQRRCLACGMRKKRCCAQDEIWRHAAACSVILCWWKLEDARADGGLLARMKAALCRGALRGAYRRAAADAPDFAAACKKQLAELAALEKENCGSLDRVADAFACLLSAAAPDSGSTARDRALSQLLYHVGRWIYIVDAADDLQEDMGRGSYNPLIARFKLTVPELQEAQKNWLAATLKHSANLAAAALELLDDTVWSGVLRNILYLGLPSTAALVLNGGFSHKMDIAPKLQGDLE